MTAPSAPAQQAKDPTLGTLALRWTEGAFLAPIVCQTPDGPKRVNRRLRIRKSRRTEYREMNEITFFPLDIEEATRCFTELGNEQPDIRGSLRIAFPDQIRPDIAQHDFDSALKRAGGFDFAVPSGSLRISGLDAQDGRVLRVDQGEVKIYQVRRGTDAARVLADWGDRPKRLLTIEAKDGTRIELQTVWIGPP